MRQSTTVVYGMCKVRITLGGITLLSYNTTKMCDLVFTALGPCLGTVVLYTPKEGPTTMDLAKMVEFRSPDHGK